MKRSFPTLAAALIGAGFYAGAAHAQLGPSSMTNGIPTGPVVGGEPRSIPGASDRRRRRRCRGRG